MVLAAADDIDIHGRLGWDGAYNLKECLGVMDVRAVQPHNEIVGFDPSLSRWTIFHHLRDENTSGIILRLQSDA